MLPYMLSQRLALVSIFFLSTHSLEASDIDSQAGEAPTSFQEQVKTYDLERPSQSLRRASGVRLNDSGGESKVQTMSIRGSGSQDVSVSLEGIPLNLENEGFFNFGDFDLFGIDSINIIKGGYSPFSTSPQGQVRLSLASPKRPVSSLEYGSFDHIAFRQLMPFSSFSFTKAKNNFFYDTGNGFERRQNNESININWRIWKRWKNHQVWAFILYSSVESPTDLEYGTPPSETDSLRPMVAYQGKSKYIDWDVWATYQERENRSNFGNSSNKVIYTGQRLSSNYLLLEKLSGKTSLEVTQATASSPNLPDRKNRFRYSFNQSVYFSPVEGQLIHPRVRAEYLTDLDDEISFHPGLGGRHRIVRNFSLLWNTAYISRAPTLIERHFSTASIRANPKLRRQNSLQADFGYELRIPDWQLNFQQAAFYTRTDDLIQFDPSQQTTLNTGRSVVYGLENQLQWEFSRFLLWKIDYTYMVPRQGNRDQLFQPRHKLTSNPNFRIGNRFELGVPLYFRTKVETFSGNDIGEQVDLGLRFNAYWNRFAASLQVFNLLAWRREEIEGFPLPQQTWFRGNLSARF